MALFPDDRIKQRHLRCLVEVVRLGRLAAAAEAMSVTPSAASKTLRELEEIVGVKLVERSRRGLAPTAAGDILYRHASASLTALQRGVELVALGHGAAQPRILVGVLPNFAVQVMPEAIRRFKQTMPQVPVRVMTGTNQSLLNQLRAGELDFVLGRLAAPDEMMALYFERLYLERFAIVCRPDHPLLAPGVLEAGNATDFPVILPPYGTVIRPEIDRFLIGRGLTSFSDVIETMVPEFARKYVLLGDALWVVPQGVVADDLGSGLLSELPIDMSTTGGPVGISTRAEAGLSDEVRALIALVRAVSAQEGPQVS